MLYKANWGMITVKPNLPPKINALMLPQRDFQRIRLIGEISTIGGSSNASCRSYASWLLGLVIGAVPVVSNLPSRKC